MSKQYQKWVDMYKHLPLDEEAIKIFEEEYSKQYSGGINSFKASYYQLIVDMNMEVLKVGDNVYYVFGKSLCKGVIESIRPYRVGYTEERIKIQGKKKLLSSHQMVKI